MPEKAPSSHQPRQEHHTHLSQSPGPHMHHQLLLREQNSHGFRHFRKGLDRTKVPPSLPHCGREPGIADALAVQSTKHWAHGTISSLSW